MPSPAEPPTSEISPRPSCSAWASSSSWPEQAVDQQEAEAVAAVARRERAPRACDAGRERTPRRRGSGTGAGRRGGPSRPCRPPRRSSPPRCCDRGSRPARSRRPSCTRRPVTPANRASHLRGQRVAVVLGWSRRRPRAPRPAARRRRATPPRPSRGSCAHDCAMRMVCSSPTYGPFPPAAQGRAPIRRPPLMIMRQPVPV